eukprot:2718231-Amphidinium_carterae.1
MVVLRGHRNYITLGGHPHSKRTNGVALVQKQVEHGTTDTNVLTRTGEGAHVDSQSASYSVSRENGHSYQPCRSLPANINNITRMEGRPQGACHSLDPSTLGTPKIAGWPYMY